MRTLSLAVVAALAVAFPAAVPSPVHAGPAKPKAELVAKKTAGAVGPTRIAVGTAVKNKGTKKAPASTVTFYLSRDRNLSGDDKTVGTTQVGKIKAKKFKTTTGTFNLPTGLTAGAYYVVACADSGHAVKERKEDNNCAGAANPVQVAGTTLPPTKQVTVTYTVAPIEASLIGKVTATTTGGTCTDNPVTGGGSCVVTAGTGTVTLTATPTLPILPFLSWSGACTGTTSPLTIPSPGTDILCTANFTPPLPIRPGARTTPAAR